MISIVRDGSTTFIVDEAAGTFDVKAHVAGPLEFDRTGQIRRVKGAAQITRTAPMTEAQYHRYLAILAQGTAQPSPESTIGTLTVH